MWRFSRLQRVARSKTNFNSLKFISSRGFSSLDSQDGFLKRHIGPNEIETKQMLKTLNVNSFEELIDKVIPADIRSQVFKSGATLGEHGLAESDALKRLEEVSGQNQLLKSFIGQGYYGTKTPSVILRNMLENSAWYTAYTPYQSEVAQGRLEMLLNFQTVVKDLTKMDVANCSLLDEGTSAAEAMNMSFGFHKGKRAKYFVSENLFKQTIGCLQTRAEALEIELIIGNEDEFLLHENFSEFCGALVQYPDKHGNLKFSELSQLSSKLKSSKCVLSVASDLMALTLFKPPGEFGADIVIGSAQRFGVPMFYGGPHAGFMAVEKKFMRSMPGRLIGVSKDVNGAPLLRMALQTREQFIKREKATSNICTAQALLANIAAGYALFHGPKGLRNISSSIFYKTQILKSELEKAGIELITNHANFDTISIKVGNSQDILTKSEKFGFNVFKQDDKTISISLDETTTVEDLELIYSVLTNSTNDGLKSSEIENLTTSEVLKKFKSDLMRDENILPHPICNSFHSETKMMRYLACLENKDITLRNSMIPLGSCTMKLNAASELLPVSWPKFKDIHPFTPLHQTEGYKTLINELNSYLAEITGFNKVSSQPNSGANGEFAGLLTIRKFHESRGEKQRNVCLIPMSAHGTNPASAVMAGMKVVGVKNTEDGRIDLVDLKQKAELHKDTLSSLMITYPSTYGVFESEVKEVIKICKDNGGRVYMDGANMNAQLCHTSPGDIGADVCHLNLHKTFAIPHGGGGPGVGSIGVTEELAPFLPDHNVIKVENSENPIGQVAAAPFGSAGILPISWMFINMLGQKGLKECSNYAILNANYMAQQLKDDFATLYVNENGFCAHEFILDFRQLSPLGLNEVDVAKRLADFGFHAATMSWPVPGTMMVEPTESESKDELDRFIGALKQIRKEIKDVESGKVDVEKSVIKNAPHSMETVVDSKIWDSVERQYTREEAVFPLPFVKKNKFWPSSRVDNAYGDRNLVCSCPPMEDYQ